MARKKMSKHHVQFDIWDDSNLGNQKTGKQPKNLWRSFRGTNNKVIVTTLCQNPWDSLSQLFLINDQEYNLSSFFICL